MDSFFSDVRYAARNLLKRPGFTAIAILTLAVGIGANSTIFSAVNALLLKPLTFPELDRVVAIWDKNPLQGYVHNEVAMANYIDWRDQNQSFEKLALYRWWSANLTGVDSPERIQGFLVTGNFFDVIGTKPIMGRGFYDHENQTGNDSVAVMTHSLWQRRFGGDPNILNKTIHLNGFPLTIVGVMPERFNFPKGAEVYAPLKITPKVASNRQTHTYYVIGRMKPGVSIQAAQAEIDAINSRLETQYPTTNTGNGSTVYPIVKDTVRMYDTALWIMMGAVAFVLLIACANVANLMLARASGRQKEIALRSALGASRWRIIRQLLTESVIVALIGGAFGVLIAFWGIDLLRAANPGEAAKFAEGWHNLGINLTVLGFTLALSLFSGIVFGLAPAWQVSKPNLNNTLKEGGRQGTSSTHRLRGSLVVFEMALSLVLLVGAGLLVRSFLSLLKTDPGFNPESILTMNLILPNTKYPEEEQRAAFYSDLVNRVKALPGVESTALVNYLPLGGSNSSDAFLIEGLPEPASGQENIGRYRVCTPDYFQTMGISLMKGRAFNEQDKAGALPVVIVNETLARKYWPNEEAIGKRMRFEGPLERAPWMQVVGVIRDVKHELNIPVSPEFYLPHAQDSWSSMVLVTKTAGNPSAMAGVIRKQVWAIDKDQPVFDVRTMEEVRSISVAVYSFSSVTLGIFAGVALLLAAIGIYGVMAFAVTQRTHEIGVRMALGARSRDVLKLVVFHGMKLALIGVVIGLVGAWALSRFMKTLLFSVGATDLFTFAVVSLCLLFAALLACYLPARRATKVDPLIALRYE
ncbi:MAG TPA: ABC transporter permease [Pyrinomonadaceae bacterium]|nr:ABC transporter permease [Pyrinomonadaceae bacterium]